MEILWVNGSDENHEYFKETAFLYGFNNKSVSLEKIHDEILASTVRVGVAPIVVSAEPICSSHPYLWARFMNEEKSKQS